MGPTKRNSIFTRDHYTCQRCQTSLWQGEAPKSKNARKEIAAIMPVLIHIVPRAQGGKTEASNLLTLCGECGDKHSKKHSANKPPSQQPHLRGLVSVALPKTQKRAKRSHLRREQKLQVFRGDNWKCRNCRVSVTAPLEGENCQYLTDTTATIDHVLPLCLGGTDNVKNLQTLCNRCNHRKANKTQEEWNTETLEQVALLFLDTPHAGIAPQGFTMISRYT